jgi:hypothetical protein
MMYYLDKFDKNWCDCGCGMKFNISEAWSKSSCGNITINYGKYVVDNELRDFDVKCCYCFREHASRRRLKCGY